jgi:O-antigen ligase
MVGALIACVITLPFSTKLCHLSIIALSINWAFEANWKNKLAIVNQSILLQLILALFVLQIIGLAFSDNMERGWFSLEKKIFFVLLPVVLATSPRLNTRELTTIFFTFIFTCLAGTLACIFTAVQEVIALREIEALPEAYATNALYPALEGGRSLYWLLFSYANLSDGIGLHPTFFSLYLACCILLLIDHLSSLPSTAMKAATILAILYFTAFIVLLSSRIVLIGLGVAFLILLGKSVVRKQRTVGLIMIAASVLIALMVVVNPVTRYRNVNDIQITTFTIEPGQHYTTAAQIRLSLWWLAVHSLKGINPIVGAGTGDVAKEIGTTSATLEVTNSISSFDPHNQYLYTWIANGIPALLVLVLCYYLPARWAWTKNDLLLVGFQFLFALVCFTESALELQKGIAFYALFSGVLFFHRQSFQTISVKFRWALHVSSGRS